MKASVCDNAVCIDDLKRAARSRLPKVLFDFVDGGSGDEATLKANYAAFDDYALVGRALHDVSQRDQSVFLFGRRHSSPLIIAPTGSSGLLWPRGEAEVARACAATDTTMIVSAGATLSIEDVAAAAEGPKWLQVFLYKDRDVTREFAARAQAAGYEALCLTVDCPLLGCRERDLRNGFTIDPKLSLSSILDAIAHPGWWRQMARTPRVTFRNFEMHSGSNIVDMAKYISELIDPAVQWKDVEWLRSVWSGPLIIKGVVRGSDARRARDAGCNAVIVSNHGGRQLDHAIATMEALPDVVAAVGGAIPILLDGGVRRGPDLLKAIAIGATAVAIGRAHLWGLAAAGAAGVQRALELIRAELDLAMALGGWSRLREIDRDCVRLVTRRGGSPR